MYDGLRRCVGGPVILKFPGAGCAGVGQSGIGQRKPLKRSRLFAGSQSKQFRDCRKFVEDIEKELQQKSQKAENKESQETKSQKNQEIQNEEVQEKIGLGRLNFRALTTDSGGVKL
jgi:hypothetical protein